MMGMVRGGLTKEEFRQKIKENPESLFIGYTKRRWFKIYCLLVSEEWKNLLFNSNEITEMGEIYYVVPEGSNGKDKEIYFIEEYKPGLILLYTYASNENYERDLGSRIDRTIGTARMWMKPDVFETFWKGLKDKTNGYIYLFSSKRESWKDGPCKIRPRYARRIEYRGDDATSALEEIMDLYGVSPYRIYLRAGHNLKVHLTNDGLFAAQRPTHELMDYYYQCLDSILEDVLELRKMSMELKYEMREIDQIITPYFKIGNIYLNPDIKIDYRILNRLRQEFEDLSFIDIFYQTENDEDSLPDEDTSICFSATVIDEWKGSVFDIEGSNNKILILPKYRSTFESYISFYRGVVESIDESAKLIVA